MTDKHGTFNKQGSSNWDDKAFPQTIRIGNVSQTEGGMTLRDWFAGQALMPIVTLLGRDVGDATDLAKDAYIIADAMLDERAKGSA